MVYLPHLPHFFIINTLFRQAWYQFQRHTANNLFVATGTLQIGVNVWLEYDHDRLEDDLSPTQETQFTQVTSNKPGTIHGQARIRHLSCPD